MRAAEILSEAQRVADEAIQLRRRIHGHPEIGLTLPRTQAAVLEALSGLELETRTGQRTTSVVARLAGGKPGPTLLLRADMDALPLREATGLPFASEVDGAMHACGHDAHVAMLVGAARVLARRRAELAGSVLFMFQPGEEGYHGARVMLDEGLLDGPSAPTGAFALHVTHREAAGVITTRPGPMLASGDTIQITVRGKGGHASAPHDCLDPIPIACEIVQAFQTLVTRRVNVFDPAVITIGKIEAGTTRNVIPETAHLLGTVRTVSEVTRERVLEGVRRVADGIATAHGAEAAVELIRGYPVTSNDAGFAAFVLDTAREMLGAERVTPMRHPVMGSEDFSYVLQRVPGAMANLGTRPDAGDVYPNHSNRMLVNEAALASGIALHVAVALRFFERGAKVRPI
jgi:hippurate hydrolase